MSKRDVSVVDLVVPAITLSGTLYTDVYSLRRLSGRGAVILTTSAGSITMNQQVSHNGETFYDAYDVSGALLGKICENQAVVTNRYIVFDPVFAKYMRFKIVEQGVGATTVTIKLLTGEEL